MAIPERGSRDLADQEGHVGGEDWQGLTVCVRDGSTLGIVVDVFTEGPLAGRLRVEGQDAAGIAVYAIPRQAVVRRQRDSLLLDVPHTIARGRWLMHVRQSNGPRA